MPKRKKRGNPVTDIVGMELTRGVGATVLGRVGGDTSGLRMLGPVSTIKAGGTLLKSLKKLEKKL